MKHFLIAGYGYIGKVHALAAPLPADFLVRHEPKEQTPYRFFTDFDAALQTKPLFLDICTPNAAHEALALRAFEKGLPVYCEKPLAHTFESAKRMVGAACTPTGVAFNYRFLPCVHLLRKLLGQIGRIYYYKASFLHDSYILPRADSWRLHAEQGGGAMGDLGIHLLDLCRFIFGKARVRACETHIFYPERTEVSELGFCTLEHDGYHGYLEVSRLSAGKSAENGIEVFGEHGRLAIVFEKATEISYYDIRDKSRTVRRADSALLETLRFPDGKNEMGFLPSSHRAALTTFAEMLESGQKSPILADFNDALAAQQLLEDALQIAKKER